MRSSVRSRLAPPYSTPVKSRCFETGTVGQVWAGATPQKRSPDRVGRYAEENRKRRNEGKPETSDFLGFTHISGKNSLGRYALRRVTIRKRMLAKNRQNKTELRKRMHDPVAQTGLWLKRSSQVTSTTQQ